MANKIVSEDYADLVIEAGSRLALANSTNITPINFRNVLLNIPVEQIDKCSITEYSYTNFPLCYTLESLVSLEKSGITQIQNNPNLALRGEGVLVGVIDTGIDYQHEAFLYPNRTTKIVSIWDQTINPETPDTEENDNIEYSIIAYGTEYKREAINEALQADNPLEVVPSTDELGHGTMIAGIINGNESIDNSFRGVVPEAELVVVKLKQAKRITRDFYAISHDAVCFQTSDILFGIKYVIDTARILERPVVVCLALGSSMGGQDGSGPLSWYVSYVSENIGMIAVISGGNEGNLRRHYSGTVEAQTYSDTFELNVGPDEYGFSMELWQEIPNLLSVEITSPSGEVISPIYPERNDCRRFSLVFERTVLYVNNIIFESNSGNQLILFRFEYPTPGIWTFRVVNINRLMSSFNVWLPSGDLISEETYFLEPDPEITLTAPSYGEGAMTITAYDPTNDNIWINSGRGYSAANIIKPELVAPGVDITCPLPGNGYGSMTGTGAAAAHASGISAMLLEWGVVRGNYPSIHGGEIKNILIRGATRDRELTYPNPTWGYGRINVYDAFDRLRT